VTVRHPILTAVCLTIVVLGAPAAARATSVGSPTVALSSRAAGVQRVRYRVQFKATSGLTGGNTGQIALTAPAGTAFPTASSAYTVTNLSTGATGFPATASVSNPAVTLSNPVAIAAGDRVQVEARQVTNSASTGLLTLAVHTSADATNANASYSLVAPAALSGLAIGLSSPAAGATGVRYRVRFTVSTNGGLAANAGTVRIVAPAGTVLPSSGAQYELTDLETGTFKSSLPVAVSGGGTIATVTTGFDLSGGHRAQLVVSNITNAAAGSQTLAVSSSSDTTVANPGFSLVAPKQLAGLQARRSSSTPGANNVTYRVQLIPSSTGALAAKSVGSNIVLTAPAGTAFPSAAGSYHVVDLTANLGNGTSSVTLSNGGATATIVPAGDIPASDLIQIVVHSVTNPAGGTDLDATTSADTVDRSATLGALPAPSLGAPTVRLTPNATAVAPARYVVDFNSAHALVANSSQITLIARLRTLFPSTECQYFIEDQTTGATGNCPTLSLAGGDGESVTITVPFAASAGDRIFIRIQQVRNSEATGAHQLSISDASAAAPFTLAAAPAVSSLRVRPTSTAAGAVAVRYDASFVAASNGALVFGESQIRVTAPPATSLPPDPGAYGVTDTTTHHGSSSVLAVAVSGSTATLTLAGTGLDTINPGDSVLVTINGVGNPNATGSQSTTLTTSSSLPATTSFSLAAATSVRERTVRLSNTTPGATGVTYTVHFQTSGYGGLARKLSNITLVGPVAFPGGCAAYTVIDTTTFPSGGCFAAGPDIGPTEVHITVGPDIAPQDDVVVKITGLTNPQNSGSYTVTISTSSDLVGANASFTLG
jgi:hypothetical protein